MTQWTIGKRITVGFGAVLLVVLVLGVFLWTRLGVVHRGMDSVATLHLPAIEQLSNIKEQVNGNIVLVFKHISSPNASDMERLESTLKANAQEVGQNFEALERAVSPQVKQTLTEVKTRRQANAAIRDQILALSRSSTNAEASARAYQKARAELDPTTQAYLAGLNQLEEQIKQEADTASKSALGAISGANTGLLIGFAVSLVLAGVAAAGIIRGTTSILRRVSSSLNEGSMQVASAATQVSTASQSLAEGASEQAASLEETSSSLEEMASMAKRNADNSHQVNQLSKQTRSAAEKGASDMKDMVVAMDTIKASSDEIAKIIKTIDEIAFQTNILALNAAVEAARAGEAGMGFAVVADEVRSLAQRCAQAAKETSEKIEGAIGRSAQGVEISGRVAKALDEILSRAREVDELAAEVASASHEQSQGVAQVNLAVSQMDKVTQSNAANAEESASAAEELNAQASAMRQSVTELLRLVGGDLGANGRQRPTTSPEPAEQSVPSRDTNAKPNGAVHPPQAIAPRVALDKPATTAQPGIIARNAPSPAPDAFRDF